MFLLTSATIKILILQIYSIKENLFFQDLILILLYNLIMKVRLQDLYREFLLLGIQLLGGGYVIVPLIQQSIIDKHNWITNEELTDFYALSQSIPGIIAANISAFIGYKIRGKSGALVALLGIITSPIISILIVALIVDYLLKISFIQSVFWGVGVAVIILVYLTIKEMWKNSLTDFVSWVIFLGCFISSFFFKFSPVLAIISSVIIGVSYKLIQKRCAK